MADWHFTCVVFTLTTVSSSVFYHYFLSLTISENVFNNVLRVLVMSINLIFKCLLSYYVAIFILILDLQWITLVEFAWNRWLIMMNLFVVILATIRSMSHVTIHCLMLDNPSNDAWFCCKCYAQTSGVFQSGCSSSLSCICLNARSIVSKRFDFLAYICANQFDIVAVTETFLDESVHDSHVSSPGYSVFCCDWDWHGGDVTLLVHDSLNAFHRLDLEDVCELLWVELPTM